MKALLGTIALACSLALSPVVNAKSWGCGEGLQSMVRSLSLQDAQKQKIQPIIDNLKTVMQQKDAAMNDLDTQIKQQSMSTSMDQSTVSSLVDKKAALIGDMMKAKINAKNQIFVILDAKQQAEWQSKMSKMEAKRAEHFKSCEKDSD